MSLAITLACLMILMKAMEVKMDLVMGKASWVTDPTITINGQLVPDLIGSSTIPQWIGVQHVLRIFQVTLKCLKQRSDKFTFKQVKWLLRYCDSIYDYKQMKLTLLQLLDQLQHQDLKCVLMWKQLQRIGDTRLSGTLADQRMHRAKMNKDMRTIKNTHNNAVYLRTRVNLLSHVKILMEMVGTEATLKLKEKNIARNSRTVTNLQIHFQTHHPNHQVW